MDRASRTAMFSLHGERMHNFIDVDYIAGFYAMLNPRKVKIIYLLPCDRKSLKQYGPDEVAKEKQKSILTGLTDNIKIPLVTLLSISGRISYLTGGMLGFVTLLRVFSGYF